MPTMLFSAPPEIWSTPLDLQETPPRSRHYPLSGRRARLSVQWQTENGEALGEEIALQSPPEPWIEYPDSDGGFGHAAAQPDISFASAPPTRAAYLGLRRAGETIARAPLERLRRWEPRLPGRSPIRIGAGDARLVIPVFSERFPIETQFLDSVHQLHSWILAQPPFTHPRVAAAFAFDAYFWAADAETGLFATPDSNSQGERLFHGDRELAKRLLDPFIATAATSLVLINSRARGGAGGQQGYSAWSSIAPRTGEPWEAVCLHELGHGFGLADEYLDPRFDRDPCLGEPNVSERAQPDEAPWRALVNQPLSRSPSFTLANETTSPPGAIGTFQGGRYRADFYRPSRDCLMKSTRATFCVVCCAHIANLAGVAVEV